MKQRTSLKKMLSLLFMTLYLVFGGVLGHAFVWCAEPGDYTHLEYNPAGVCGTECGVDVPVKATTAPALAGENCEDLSSKALFSEVFSPRVDDSPAFPALISVDVAQWLTETPPSFQLVVFSPAPEPDRPPTIAQLSIKTIVLRH